MASVAFPETSDKIQLSDGVTYGFVHVKPSPSRVKPYILLLHGFPSSSYDWRYQIDFLAKEGYGVLAPDLLGYGDTDKPTDIEAYKGKTMAGEMASLLEALGIDLVIGVGHDWGSGLLSKLANYHPERLIAYVFLDIGYQSPDSNFSIDNVNQISTEQLGYPVFGYWHFFNSADAAELMDRNAECTVSSLFPADPLSWKENLAAIGAARRWFEENKVGPVASWLSSEEVKTHNKIFAPENGGYGPPLNWYKSRISHVNNEDEASIPEEKSLIGQPTLLVTCSKDPVGVAGIAEARTRPFVKNLQVKQVDTGHWLQLEKPDEVNQILKDFFEGLKAAKGGRL
ncbi:MAG: hypothetical protein Q9195_004206 [Heterodermia aff. obscurata]